MASRRPPLRQHPASLLVWGWAPKESFFYFKFVNGSAPPNMRLQLVGGDRFRGSGVIVPWRAQTVVQHACAGGRYARSLSAIR